MKLPTLLAGPILRRCDQSEINVWLATSKAVAGIGATLQAGTSGAASAVQIKTTWLPMQAAPNLWIHILQIFPSGNAFPTDKILLYEVGLQNTPGGKIVPFDETEIDGTTYPEFNLSSLVLQERGVATLNLLYGSCRKYHGPGFDATRAADQLMRNRINDLNTRPHAMMLGGDQIYADDVPAAITPAIQELANALMGMEEPLPGIKTPTSIALNGRQKYSNGGKLTSDHALNHLFTFGEFCAAYLLSWNPGLWPKLPTWADIYDELDEKPPVNKAEAIYKAQIAAVEEFKAGGAAIRRLLANVPTYMMFDDHEVTDDWFLNGRWKRDVLKNKLGRRVVANGMCAFWLFQAIGNYPQFFYNKDALKTLNKHTTSLTASKSAESSESDDFDDFFSKLNNWAFVAPTSPGIICMNTRTARTSSSNRKHTRYSKSDWRDSVSIPSSAPRLMNASELTNLRSMVIKQLAQDRRLIVMAPAPVYGFDSIESAQDVLVKVRARTPGQADFESFHADPNSFLDVIDVLLNATTTNYLDEESEGVKPELVLFLSGDVHYGFTTAIALRDLKGGGAPIPMAQFTSSGAKNMPDGVLGALLATLSAKIAKAPDNFHFWWRKGTDGAAHSMMDVDSVSARSGGEFSLQQSDIQPYFTLFAKKSTSAKLRFAQAFRMIKASSTSLLLKENNMGLLELNHYHVTNRLLTWNGSLNETLKTSWNAKSNWPVKITNKT